MALHRDIFWVGRQWAVTGFGVQAVDQRLKGAFDIEIARLWDDDLPQRMRALAWLRGDDFEKALEIARSRFPEPPRKTLPLIESVLELISPTPDGSAKQEVTPQLKSQLEPPLPLTEAGAPSREPPQAPIAAVEAGLSCGEPPASLISPVEASPTSSGVVAIDPPPQPTLALRVEGVSAKFLPRWRVRR
jgi:hypothetical protein